MKLRLRLFEHVLLVLALAVVIFAAAIVLARMTQWAEARELPAYLVQGMHLVGKVLFSWTAASSSPSAASWPPGCSACSPRRIYE